MSHRTGPKAAELARDKARKQVQNLFDKFKEPAKYNRIPGGYLLHLDGPPILDDNDLARFQVKLLPFDVSGKATPNSAPSFFNPPSGCPLKDYPVDVEAMEGDGLEMLEIGDPIDDPLDRLDQAYQIWTFLDGQYFHVPRANLGPDPFETLCEHSSWRRVCIPNALLEYDQGIDPPPNTPCSHRWATMDIFEYGDAPTVPHIIATTLNGVEGSNRKLLRSELVSILQLMVNRMGQKGHENDAIVPVLIFSIMSARRGRLLQAYFDGEHLIIQLTDLLSCKDEDSPFFHHFFRYMMSEAVGNTSDLEDLTAAKAVKDIADLKDLLAIKVFGDTADLDDLIRKAKRSFDNIRNGQYS